MMQLIFLSRLGMQYSLITASEGCSTEMVKGIKCWQIVVIMKKKLKLIRDQTVFSLCMIHQLAFALATLWQGPI